MEYQVSHTTRYKYAHPVGRSYQSLHLTPRSSTSQDVLNSQLHVDPGPQNMQRRQDYFGNAVTDIVIRERHETLTIRSMSRVVVREEEDILLDLSPGWEQVRQLMQSPTNPGSWDASRYCFPSPQISLDEARDYAAPLMTPGKPCLRLAMELTEQIYQEFEYQGGVSDVYTPVPESLRTRTGVCQDFAHVAIACLRAFGLPARYVSGYLLTRPRDGQPRLTGADASHAWFAAWCAEFGWVDFDPTNNLRPRTEHITLGWGRDYSDVSPTRGYIHGGGAHALEVAVDVIPSTHADQIR